MTYTALVPVKALNVAKSRLAAYLSWQQRESLVLDMLHHVLQILLASCLFERVSVVSPDTRVLENAQFWGAQPLKEERHGHNFALQAAAMREQAAGATAILTISADLPLLCICDIQGMIEQSRQHAVVLAPSQDGTGTNAILMHPPLALPYLFGLNSRQRFQQAARQQKLSSTVYTSIGLAMDIDTIDDLQRLRDKPGRREGERNSYRSSHERPIRKEFLNCL
jgi:2-phospho-L-lactate/phosphoenolpyruvate guanylyltransferase